MSLNVHYCVLFSRRVRVRVRIRFSDWLVSCYAHVLVLLSVLTVTLPIINVKSGISNNYLLQYITYHNNLTFADPTAPEVSH